MNGNNSKLKRVKYKKEDDDSDAAKDTDEESAVNRSVNDWLVRSYDDFIQQSVEVGSFLNYSPSPAPAPAPVVPATVVSTKSSASPSSLSNTGTHLSNGVGLDLGVNTPDKLILIKYKKTNDEIIGPNGVKTHPQQKKHRELHSLLFFIFFLFVTIITLSQIIVMHSQTSNSNFYQIKLMQEELKLMDLSIDKMLKEKHVLPMQVWYALKRLDENLKKFSNFMDTSGTQVYFSFNETAFNNINNSGTTTETTSLLNDLIACNISYSINLVNYLKHNESLGDLVNSLNDLVVHFARARPTNGTDVAMSLHGVDDHCARLIIDTFFVIFNRKYSQLFETSNVYLKHLNKYELVNEALLLASSGNEHQNNKTNLQQTYNSFNDTQPALAPSLRNIENFLIKYKKSYNKFDPKIKLCNPQPPVLYGQLNISEKKANNRTFIEQLESENDDVQLGGHWSPANCQARHKVAIIIPYRDREDHLVTLLYYLHPILKRQQLEYKIYVTEQSGNGTFNKAIIMNAAFIYAFDQDNFHCYCFHDVDLVPEDDRNMYSCSVNPKHMSIGVDEMNYKLQYEELIGGVLIMRTEHVIAANGYSNLYWGWGAEDDDLYYRLKGLGYKVERPPLKIGRYKMMKHEKRKPQLWSKRAKLLYSSVNRMTWDGISSAKYTLLNVTKHKLYTHLLIDVGTPPAGFN